MNGRPTPYPQDKVGDHRDDIMIEETHRYLGASLYRDAHEAYYTKIYVMITAYRWLRSLPR